MCVQSGGCSESMFCTLSRGLSPLPNDRNLFLEASAANSKPPLGTSSQAYILERKAAGRARRPTHSAHFFEEVSDNVVVVSTLIWFNVTEEIKVHYFVFLGFS